MTEISLNETSVSITVDGREVLVHPGELLIDACERDGTYIPRFCHHSRMKPVGMCRMCLVEVDTGRGLSLQPSCMIECASEMVVNTQSEKTLKAQEGVLEFLLLNHPLDCPICDKGGECPLQDQTMEFGPGESRFIEEKRTYKKPIPINENVFLDRERCVLCDRCTRFADQVAGDPLIHFIDRGNKTQVNTYPDMPFSSYFSGNTVQVCPVGALTAAPYRFKARPWDLSEIESTSTLNSVGNRISVQESRDRVLRFTGIDSDAVNWGWLSDKERFIFEAYNSEFRLDGPLIRRKDEKAQVENLISSSWSEAYDLCIKALRETPPERMAFIGGARMTNEAQYAWCRFAKGILGTDNFDSQLDDGIDAEVILGLPRSTINETCKPGSLIILLGPDPKEELGSLYLRLRHAIVNDGCKLVELTPNITGLSHLATHSIRIVPGAATSAVDAIFGAASGFKGEILEKLLEVGRAIEKSDSINILIGRSSLAESSTLVEQAAISFHEKLPEARFLSLLRRGNIHGAMDMGLSPGLLPGRKTLGEAAERIQECWQTKPEEKGLNSREILESAANGEIDVLVLLAADLINDVPDSNLVKTALKKTKMVIAVDIFCTEALVDVDVVLAAAAPTEVDGSFTNLEGRVSPIRKNVTPPGTSRPDWMIAIDFAEQISPGVGPSSLDALRQEISSVSEIHSNLDLNKLDNYDLDGFLLEGKMDLGERSPVKTPAQKKGTLRLVITRSMYDRGTLLSHSPSLIGLAEKSSLRVNPFDLKSLGIPNNSKVVIKGAKDQIRAQLVADERVTLGTLHVQWNHEGPDIRRIIDSSLLVTDLRIELA